MNRNGYQITINKTPNKWRGFDLQPNHITGRSKKVQYAYIFTGRVRNNEALCYVQDKYGVWGEWEQVWLPVNHDFVIAAMSVKYDYNVGNVVLTQKYRVPGLRTKDGDVYIRSKSTKGSKCKYKK